MSMFQPLRRSPLLKNATNKFVKTFENFCFNKNSNILVLPRLGCFARSACKFSSVSYNGGILNFNDTNRRDFNRSYPSYRVFGEECALSLEPTMPIFKTAGRDGVALSQPGYIVLGFTPRLPGRSKLQWNDTVKFRLSIEEVGLILKQVPDLREVEISRRGLYSSSNNNNKSISTQSGVPDKVLTITPQTDFAITFKADMVLDGIGGQEQGQVNYNNNASSPSPVKFPLEVNVQLGEFEVIKELLKSSIPYLSGWNAMLEISMNESLQKCEESTSKYDSRNTNNDGMTKKLANNDNKFSVGGTDGTTYF